MHRNRGTINTDKNFTSKCNNKSNEEKYAREVLKRFMVLAWRRPLEEKEVEPFVNLFSKYRPEFALALSVIKHTSPQQFGKVMSMTKPRLAVGFHFYNDHDTLPIMLENNFFRSIIPEICQKLPFLQIFI